jgi:probable phosphoglycerate mutase
MLTIIALVRHGVTVWNQDGRIQGQLDTDLHEEGRIQAAKLAKRIHKADWDLIISSDLRRAAETADIISDLTGIPVVHRDERLRESALGELEGTTLQDRIERWGENWRSLAQGIETDELIQERGLACVLEHIEHHRGRRILFVSHGGLIRRLLQRMLQEELKEPIRNTSLTILQRSTELWESKLMNCISHLDNYMAGTEN